MGGFVGVFLLLPFASVTAKNYGNNGWSAVRDWPIHYCEVLNSQTVKENHGTVNTPVDIRRFCNILVSCNVDKQTFQVVVRDQEEFLTG